MSQARNAPREAYDYARSWSTKKGGVPAEHCEAVAMLGLGLYDGAAKKLYALAVRLEKEEQEKKKEPGALADQLLAQSANAWLIAGDLEKAFVAQSLALKRRPNNVELLIDRAVTLASDGRYWEAVDDLNRAIELDPEHAEALVYRATAYRHLDSLALAEEDVVRALRHAPGHPEGLLEKGNIRRLQGDEKAAKTAWAKVIEIAPQSPAAESARLNIDRLR